MIHLTPAECVTRFLQEAERLGIEVRWARDGMTNLDAAYIARPGVPGTVLLHDRTPRPGPQQLCTLLAHEMVHVLQHWKGKLQATPPLGWPVDEAPHGRTLSPQQKEAYTAQNDPAKVLRAVTTLTPFQPQAP